MNGQIKFASPTFYLVAALGLGTMACRDPIPCSDCDDSVADMEEGPTPDLLPDLPCGGADLQTDPLNCGTCGNDCLWFAGTEWEAGACESGECVGPGWSGCLWEAFGPTCGAICTGSGATCVAGGCSDYTALLIHVGGIDVNCDIPSVTPYATMNGPCDEPIPYEDDGTTYVICCCG
jgi:hypothetical protein